MPPSPLDVAIAGCGPAGLATALFLSRAGHRVTLFDQFDDSARRMLPPARTAWAEEAP
jgi:2-polyprenyl-6-methoxyphenol hydroxylase-like FAD-dependent oxidoreductase